MNHRAWLWSYMMRPFESVTANDFCTSVRGRQDFFGDFEGSVSGMSTGTVEHFVVHV